MSDGQPKVLVGQPKFGSMVVRRTTMEESLSSTPVISEYLICKDFYMERHGEKSGPALAVP